MIREGTTDMKPNADAPPRFLVLDDNPDDRRTAIRLLTHEFPGAAADEVFDGEGFERALAGEPYTAVITDYQMQWTDGIQALRRIKELWPDCPVVLFTASGNEEVAVEAMKAGADDYVIKTVKRLARLPHAVRHAIERATGRRRLAQAEIDLREQAEALKEEHRRKDEFLAMLAHELRNPLSPIRSAAHLIRLRVAATGEQAVTGACEIIERQVEALSRMVEDLLDVARVNRGAIQLHPEEVDVGLAMARAVEVARPHIDWKSQSLDVRPPEPPVTVLADPTRLVQVFANLLSNASKFTPEGGRIVIAAAREGGSVVVRVSDTGIGISPELLPHVFDLFKQGDRSLDRSQGGLGIGLTLVQRLVEQHGGSVMARSEGVGRGSEVAVRLPVLEKSEPPPATDSEYGQTSSPRRVLVVDDNRDAADSLAELIQILGHEAATAYDGPAALAGVEEGRPDLVLLDIGLPGMSGYEVAQAVRRGPGGGAIKIVAVSGYGRESDKELSRKAGFDDHLVKPVAMETLERLLRGGVT